MTPGVAQAFGLTGARFLVTGAASGIGAATAALLVKEGASVTAVDRDAEGLDILAERLGTRRLTTEIFDLSRTNKIDRFVTEVAARQGRLDGLVHPAAILTRGTLAEVSIETLQEHVSVNVSAAVVLNRAVANAMAADGVPGRIVNFVSPVWATGSSANADVYAISKAGVLTLTRSMSREYGAAGILVNAISPGQIDTPMQHKGNDAGVIATAKASCPLGRMGRPEEVAAVAAFLMSPAASFISGAVIPVTGGSTPW